MTRKLCAFYRDLPSRKNFKPLFNIKLHTFPSRSILPLLEQKIQIKEGDKIILLGDYIDRGTQSKEVIDYIIDLKEKGIYIVPLLGNHEAMLLDANNNEGFTSKWIQNGGSETLKSFSISSLKDIES